MGRETIELLLLMGLLLGNPALSTEGLSLPASIWKGKELGAANGFKVSCPLELMKFVGSV